MLVQNPGLIDASVGLTYMTQTGPKLVWHDVLAHSRATFSMAQDVGGVDASVQVRASVPVIAERSMYRYNKREGHESVGATAPANDFYLAEGTTSFGLRLRSVSVAQALTASSGLARKPMMAGTAFSGDSFVRRYIC